MTAVFETNGPSGDRAGDLVEWNWDGSSWSDQEILFQIGDGDGETGSQIVGSSYDADEYMMLSMTADEDDSEFIAEVLRTGGFNQRGLKTNVRW